MWYREIYISGSDVDTSDGHVHLSFSVLGSPNFGSVKIGSESKSISLTKTMLLSRLKSLMVWLKLSEGESLAYYDVKGKISEAALTRSDALISSVKSMLAFVSTALNSELFPENLSNSTDFDEVKKSPTERDQRPISLDSDQRVILDDSAFENRYGYSDDEPDALSDNNLRNDFENSESEGELNFKRTSITSDSQTPRRKKTYFTNLDNITFD